jgi:hypothetical protein
MAPVVATAATTTVELAAVVPKAVVDVRTSKAAEAVPVKETPVPDGNVPEKMPASPGQYTEPDVQPVVATKVDNAI